MLSVPVSVGLVSESEPTDSNLLSLDVEPQRVPRFSRRSGVYWFDGNDEERPTSRVSTTLSSAGGRITTRRR